MYKLICLLSSYYRYACVKVGFKKLHKRLKTKSEAISCRLLLKSHILKLYTIRMFLLGVCRFLELCMKAKQKTCN